MPRARSLKAILRMQPYNHQTEISGQGAAILAQHGAVYLAMEERTGKTLTAILIAEKAKAKRVLVVTKAKALPDWLKTIKDYKPAMPIDVVSYHQAYKHSSAAYDFAIIDEAHAILSGYPKPGKILREVRQVVYGKPIVYLSATPHAQSYSQLFHQFALWHKSPWAKFANFYRWHNVYGKPYVLDINGISITQYDRTQDDKVLADVQHIFITKTRKELGFEQEPEDVVHYVQLSDITKSVYNELVKNELVELKAGMLVCDTASKMRFSLHQLEGGTCIIDNKPIVLANREKIDFIMDKWGDSKDLVIMYHYKAELTKLSAIFKNAQLLQATSYAEGVDLSMYKHLVIYSQDFSTAKHTQRRARQANKNRSEDIKVHFLLVKGGLSERVYNTVGKNKKNFVDTVFTRIN